ncbi:IS30 family transposase [Lacticaseibacillus zeae]|uniref:IS30 family transposase n=1 Tax=Lacticaseibacillus rhamnosus TaxID=47715 RepID=UPI001E39921C|nr:IS30 family transposase [Lacticaseibacillus rhamnosus]MDE3316865.1 IS30 family transposase [Lacticaseibacillus zeae]
MTADNGSEFADLSNVLDGVADVYYAHPYRSSERGTNETHNRMLRRDFPKGTSLDAVSPQDVAEAGSKINNLPRLILKYQTPIERFSAESARARRRAAKAAAAD